MEFSCSALFHMKTGVCLKYFVHVCSYKKLFREEECQGCDSVTQTFEIRLPTKKLFFVKFSFVI